MSTHTGVLNWEWRGDTCLPEALLQKQHNQVPATWVCVCLGLSSHRSALPALTLPMSPCCCSSAWWEHRLGSGCASPHWFFSSGLTAWCPCASGLGWELLRSLNTLGTEAWFQALPRESYSGVRRGTLQKPSAWDTRQRRGVSQHFNLENVIAICVQVGTGASNSVLSVEPKTVHITLDHRAMYISVAS